MISICKGFMLDAFRMKCRGFFLLLISFIYASIEQVLNFQISKPFLNTS